MAASSSSCPATALAARCVLLLALVGAALGHRVTPCIFTTKAGGPRWRVLLGRRDGTTTNIENAKNLPSPFDPLDKLQEKFRNFNLDATDLVALQGAHTFGKVQCQFTQQNCTASQSSGTLENLDQVTPKVFDNKYYRAALSSYLTRLCYRTLPRWRPLLPLFIDLQATNKIFFRNFAASMVKMGNISPLIGTDGEIRKNSRRTNSKSY